jgi:hypothetical protein
VSAGGTELRGWAVRPMALEDIGPVAAELRVILELHAATAAVAFHPGPELGHTEL